MSSITLKNNWPIGPNSPRVTITQGSGKTATSVDILPQNSISLGEGDINVAISYPDSQDKPKAKPKK